MTTMFQSSILHTRQQLSKLIGTSLKAHSVQIYIVIILVYLVTCFYIYYSSLVSCASYFPMQDEFPRVLDSPIKGHTQA